MPPRRAAPRFVVERRALALAEGPGRPRARLGVVADTHGAPHEGAARHLAALGVDAIVHAGDIGDEAALRALERVAPVHAIRGNIDPVGRPDALVLSLGGLLRLLVVHIGVAGPRLRADAARLADAEGASLVICGHSHVPFIGRDRGLLVLNPGSIGPRRFHLPIVFAVLELSQQLSLWHVDCETGARWEPY